MPELKVDCCFVVSFVFTYLDLVVLCLQMHSQQTMTHDFTCSVSEFMSSAGSIHQFTCFHT